MSNLPLALVNDTQSANRSLLQKSEDCLLTLDNGNIVYMHDNIAPLNDQSHCAITTFGPKHFKAFIPSVLGHQNSYYNQLPRELGYEPLGQQLTIQDRSDQTVIINTNQLTITTIEDTIGDPEACGQVTSTTTDCDNNLV